MALYDILLAQKLSGSNASKSMISDAYDSTKTYAVGDYCIYNNTLYICKTAITTAEEWTPAHWDATNCTEELSELKQSLDALSNKQTPVYNPNYFSSSAYKDVKYVIIGKVCILSGRFQSTSEKPSGQSNYLMQVPIPQNITPVKVLADDADLMINGSGYLTSNNAVPADYYNIMVAYVLN